MEVKIKIPLTQANFTNGLLVDVEVEVFIYGEMESIHWH